MQDIVIRHIHVRLRNIDPYVTRQNVGFYGCLDVPDIGNLFWFAIYYHIVFWIILLNLPVIKTYYVKSFKHTFCTQQSSHPCLDLWEVWTHNINLTCHIYLIEMSVPTKTFCGHVYVCWVIDFVIGFWNSVENTIILYWICICTHNGPW